MAAVTFTPDELAHFKRIMLAHGIMAVLAWVVLAPLGAILLRSLTGHKAIWVHGMWQMVMYAIFIAAVGMGIWMAGRLEKSTGYHPIIGLVIFALTSIQPVGGLVAHLLHRRRRRSTIWGISHGFGGVSLISLGMINGGLGILFAGGAVSRSEAVAYGVVTGCIWTVYVAFTVGCRSTRRKAVR